MSALRTAVPRNSTIVLLDYPLHSNVGDFLIYLGTEVWLQQEGASVLGQWHCHNFRFPELPREVIVVCQGGGNFGDLYRHQLFREKVVSTYQHHRIVFLPQSIHYRSADPLQQSRRILAEHEDLHLFLRDTRSLDFAREHFSSTHMTLAPDMATMLYPIGPGLKTRAHVGRNPKQIALIRADEEQPPELALKFSEGCWQGDWADLLGMRRRIISVYQALGHVPAGDRYHQSLEQSWIRVVRTCTSKCVAFFADAEWIASLRLHGHILACLLGIPNDLYDNNYGKNSAYFHTWHRELGFARFIH